MSDGRDINPALGTLAGEGSQQETRPQGKTPPPAESWYLVPARRADDGLEPTYYDRPVIKPPVWIWSIPAYFYVGGLAGAAMSMGMTAQLAGGRELRSFSELCRWMGATGGGIGTALLIADLGRKRRFLMMLRVFRATSPMSIGSWVLAAATPLSAGSALLTTASNGWLRRLGNAAGIGAGVLGLPLAVYTSVLITNTAIPVWQATGRSLPLLFAASSVASMGSICDLLPLNERERLITRRFGTVGRVAEVAAGIAVERDAARVERVAMPLNQGVSGALWKTAKVLTFGSLVCSLLPGRSRAARLAAGTLGTLGSLALRFAVFHAGKASALDPRATFRQQRSAVSNQPSAISLQRAPSG